MLALLAGGCAGSLGERASPRAESAEDEWGGVEILAERDPLDEFDSETSVTGAADRAGEVLVVFAFLGVVLAAALFPFLLL